MLMVLGLLLDGVVTLALAAVIATEWKTSPSVHIWFYLGLVAVHGLVAGFCILILLGTRILDQDVAGAFEAITTERPRREPKVVPAFTQPRLDRAA